MASKSMFAHWLGRKANIEATSATVEARLEEAARFPGYESITYGWGAGEPSPVDDYHWSAQGHQWAAAALLEWLRENPQVCDDADPA